MKYIHWLVILISCGQVPSDNSSFTCATRSVDFGSSEICLPKILGMIECAEEDKIKTWARSFELDVNQYLAYYLSEDSYNRLGIADIDDYAILMSPKSIKDYTATSKDLTWLEDNLVKELKKLILKNTSKRWNTNRKMKLKLAGRQSWKDMS